MANEDNIARLAGQVRIGNLSVNRLGLGTNRISDTIESAELLNYALRLGVNFIDTAHRYGGGASETTIGKVLSPYSKGLVIATKGGYSPGGEAGTPEGLRQNLEESLIRLRLERIDLYQLHRVDPNVPLEESMAALKSFQEEGKIRHIGLSEVSISQIEAARKVVDIMSVQNEYNVIERRHDDVVDYCEREGIVFIPWFPLGGLSGGAQVVEERLAEMSARYKATPQQLALAWLLKRSKTMLPIPGTLSIKHLESNLRAGELDLSNEDFRAISNLV